MQSTIMNVRTYTTTMPCLVLLLAFGAILYPAAALNFHAPSIKGQLLDYCNTPNGKPEECGQPVADAWCKALGYDLTTGFTGPTPVFIKPQGFVDSGSYYVAPGNQTLAIGSDQTCVATPSKNCSTFVAIDCIHSKLFLDPKVEGKLLDWCLEGDKGCGREAASDFCIKQGFSHGSWSYGGPYWSSFQDTYQPKTGKVCNSKTEKCQAFSSIFCER